jgi:hypothetical protein
MYGAGWRGGALLARARALACGRGGRRSAAPAARSLDGRRVPVEELDDDAIGVGDLERALAPGLLAQRHGDVHALLAQAGQLTLEVLDDERRKPKWLVRNAAEAGTSATLRDTAEAVICTEGSSGWAIGTAINTVSCTVYCV